MSIGKSIRFYFSIRLYLLKEQLRVVKKYYKSLRFCLFDLCFFIFYFFFNPYRENRKYLKKIGVFDVSPYGETPLTSWATIAKKCELSSSDTLLELGAGRGRHCFWSYFFISCRIIAIERTKRFVSCANLLKKMFFIKKIQFICADFFALDFSSVSVIYLYGTCLTDEEIKKLIEKFKTLSKKIKIITISFSLCEYDTSFILEKEFLVSFPWGQASCFLQTIG